MSRSGRARKTDPPKMSYTSGIKDFFSAWNKYDKNFNGEIEGKELKDLCRDIVRLTERNPKDQEIEAVINDVLTKHDVNRNGRIGMKELASYFQVNKDVFEDQKVAVRKADWKVVVEYGMAYDEGGKSLVRRDEGRGGTKQDKTGGSSSHFACWNCDNSLLGYRYILREDHPYCVKCYEDIFANTCEECHVIIGTDSKDLSYRDKHWHEKCFNCSDCHCSLTDKPFGAKNDLLYCAECYEDNFSARCDTCDKVFHAGTKKLEWRGQCHHEDCFTCFVCKNPIGTKAFVPKDDKPYCTQCYEDRFATRCTKCNKVITSGGVTYKGEPFHRECFTCAECTSSLAGQRFTTRDEQPVCAECFGKLYAKQCVDCGQPITGIGATKFITFEEQHWHNECFVCRRCESSLVGRGFITQGDEILCPDCGRTTYQ